MFSILHLVFAVIQFAFGVITVRHYQRSRSSYLLIALANMFGLVYDNIAIALGALIGAGDVLKMVNVPRFYIHALITPLIIIYAFDAVAQAMGGGMSITGLSGSPPVRAGIPIGDLGGGLMGVVGLLAALVARQHTGRGQHVDVSMLDAQISLLNYMATMYFLSGETPYAIGNSHFVHVPYDAFPTSDGFIIIAVIVDEFWKNLMPIVALPELDIEENQRQPGRWKNRALINRRLAEKLQTNTQAHWLAQLRAARIPCAPVNNFEQALTNEQVLARNMVVEVEHPQGGAVKMPGNPVKLSDHEDTYAPPPLLGQHTDEVLKRLLGKTDEAIRDWRLRGVI